ncbi:restriction endonuclease subunit S [Flavobacterium granuli]|uniref:Type I restriction enzyme S subunit n=1 Tax=Flavobacterium granuli TaxID=280093 RepID=A0A1M5NX98_9FLAO|nr:restriction endonuclease subunit S [Flavobacterium granuli]PRZ23432.1 type I restriction enzyme S subunit [Flavobacterium granuli]SHG94214.1 type I restriction enzyme, S subunit [Flavobacterium granuli]
MQKNALVFELRSINLLNVANNGFGIYVPNNPKQIPNLRFPEFSNNWEMKKLGEVMDFKVTNSFSRENLNYELGTVKNIHYGDIHTKFQTLFNITNEIVPFINDEINILRISDENYCREGDIIFADASEDLNDVGKSIEVVNVNGEKLLSGLHTLLARPKENLFYLGFNGYLFKSNQVRTQIQKESQGSKVLSINVGRISKIELSFPDVKEQERITALLSLLDERIHTQNKIIEELKRLKVSLIKKIFSQHFRFQDENGCDFPDWEEKTLEEVVEFRNGKAHENHIVEKGKYIVVNSKFISQNGNIRKYSNECNMPLYKDEIVMVMSDVPNGKALAKCFLINKNDKYTLNQRICALKAVSCHNPFLYYLINRNEYYLAFDSGVGQTNLKKDDVLNCPLIMPSSITEQIIIANFLSSIDSKIDIEVQLLSKYESQKKYLLQNMFI